MEWTEIFVFPLSEDLNKFVNLMELNGEDRYINSNQMDFGVTVFAGFRGTHIDNLFPPTLACTDSHANHEVCPRTLQGRLLIRTYPFLRSAEHCIGKLSPCQYYSTKKDEKRGISRGDVPHRVSEGEEWFGGERESYLKEAPAEAEEKSCS